MVRKMVQLRILSSVTTLQAHKSESEVETKFCKYQTTTIKVLVD